MSAVQDYDSGEFGTIGVVARACPLCGRDNGDVTPDRNSRDIWHLKHCRDCAFVYIDKAPDYAALFTTMAWERTSKAEERHRAEIRPISYRASKLTRARMRILPRKKIHLMVAAHAVPGNVIDLGCGTGGAMEELGREFTPYGVEISAEAAKAANQRFSGRGGHAINAPSIEGLKSFADGFFTAATLRSYLEHEMNPAGVLKALHRTLAPGGIAIIKVPNYACWNRAVMGARWCGFRFPDHLNYFTPQSLSAMAEQCGYSVRFGWTYKLPTSDNMYALLSKEDATPS